MSLPRLVAPRTGRSREVVPRALAAIFLLVPAAGSWACAGGAFTHHFQRGEYEAAVVAFRADSTLWRDEEALYRMAFMRASPVSPVYDLEKARELFRRLLRIHPRTSYRRQSVHMLSVLDRLSAYRDSTASLKRQLEALKSIDVGPDPPDPRTPARRDTVGAPAPGDTVGAGGG